MDVDTTVPQLQSPDHPHGRVCVGVCWCVCWCVSVTTSAKSNVAE